MLPNSSVVVNLASNRPSARLRMLPEPCAFRFLLFDICSFPMDLHGNVQTDDSTSLQKLQRFKACFRKGFHISLWSQAELMGMVPVDGLLTLLRLSAL